MGWPRRTKWKGRGRARALLSMGGESSTFRGPPGVRPEDEGFGKKLDKGHGDTFAQGGWDCD